MIQLKPKNKKIITREFLILLGSPIVFFFICFVWNLLVDLKHKREDEIKEKMSWALHSASKWRGDKKPIEKIDDFNKQDEDLASEYFGKLILGQLDNTNEQKVRGQTQTERKAEMKLRNKAKKSGKSEEEKIKEKSMRIYEMALKLTNAAQYDKNVRKVAEDNKMGISIEGRWPRLLDDDNKFRINGNTLNQKDTHLIAQEIAKAMGFEDYDPEYALQKLEEAGAMDPNANKIPSSKNKTGGQGTQDSEESPVDIALKNIEAIEKARKSETNKKTSVFIDRDHKLEKERKIERDKRFEKVKKERESESEIKRRKHIERLERLHKERRKKIERLEKERLKKTSVYIDKRGKRYEFNN